MNFLSIDVGTSCCKCQLFSESGEILEYVAEEYDLKRSCGEIYLDADEIIKKVGSMIERVGKLHEITSIAVSSLGESFVLLDGNDEILFYPMLYTDPRGEVEARQIEEKLTAERVFAITGTTPHSMYSVSKLLMIKNNYPEIYARAKRALLICDYVGYCLTGRCVIDYGLAARTGAFDVGELVFSAEILGSLGIDPSLFSTPMPAGSVVGHLKEDVCRRLGLKSTPILVLGSHDQVCATLGAGALRAGNAADGMGTVECITVLFDKKSNDIKMGKQGYPIVPYAKEGLYCTYILNYSCGSLVSWVRKNVMHGYSGDADSFFEYMESKMKDEPSGILALPYFGGAATPYQDINAKGALIGLTTEVTDAELYRSVLEGTAMEMRLNAEAVGEYGIRPISATATGGGANSRFWLKIKADIQNIAFRTLRSSEGGLCGCAILQAVAMRSKPDLESAVGAFVRFGDEFLPTEEGHAAYEEQYRKYKKLYKTIKELY